MNNEQKNKFNLSSRGFTLVEILVVLVIAAVVLSIAIPKIRTINKERNLREAARVVGSLFANASQRAVIDGVAGVRIVRNPNYIIPGTGTGALGTEMQYAATEISLLRSVPNFVGDSVGADIENALPAGMPDNAIAIDMPLEQEALGIIQAGDFISFGNSRSRYRILSISPDTTEDGMPFTPPIGDPRKMQLIVDLAGYLPAPQDEAAFSVYRRPRVLRSSTTRLPDNYILDLRYSGFDVLDGFYDPDGIPDNGDEVGSFVPPYTGAVTTQPRQLTSVFEPAPVDLVGGPYSAANPPIQNYSIDFIFDEEGSIETVVYEGGGNTVFRLPLALTYFLISEAPNSVDAANEISTADENALWVTIGNSGTTNIGYNNAAESGGITVNVLSAFYFAADPDMDTLGVFLEEGDRDEFNGIIRRSREDAGSSSANQ